MCLRVKVVCWRGWMGYFEENEEKWERGGGGVLDDGWWSRKCKVLIKRKWGQLWRGWRVEVHVAQMANLCRCDMWQRERERERWSFWTDCWTQSWSADQNKCAGADFPRARVKYRWLKLMSHTVKIWGKVDDQWAAGFMPRKSFLYAVIMKRLTDEVRQECPWTVMFADHI